MQEKKVMNAVMQYLQEQQISKQQILKDTNIYISSEKDLSASEFLSLCSYLRKDPEDFMKKCEEIGHDSISM